MGPPITRLNSSTCIPPSARGRFVRCRAMLSSSPWMGPASMWCLASSRLARQEPAASYRFYLFEPRRLKILDEAEFGDGIFVSAEL